MLLLRNAHLRHEEQVKLFVLALLEKEVRAKQVDAELLQVIDHGVDCDLELALERGGDNVLVLAEVLRAFEGDYCVVRGSGIELSYRQERSLSLVRGRLRLPLALDEAVAVSAGGHEALQELKLVLGLEQGKGAELDCGDVRENQSASDLGVARESQRGGSDGAAECEVLHEALMYLHEFEVVCVFAQETPVLACEVPVLDASFAYDDCVGDSEGELVGSGVGLFLPELLE